MAKKKKEVDEMVYMWTQANDQENAAAQFYLGGRGYMNKAKVRLRAMWGRCSGGERRQSRGMNRYNATWGSCMIMAEA